MPDVFYNNPDQGVAQREEPQGKGDQSVKVTASEKAQTSIINLNKTTMNNKFEGQTISEVAQAQREEASASSMTSNENFISNKDLAAFEEMNARIADFYTKQESASLIEANNNSAVTLNALMENKEHLDVEIKMSEGNAIARITAGTSTTIKFFCSSSLLIELNLYGITGKGQYCNNNDSIVTGAYSINAFVAMLINSKNKIQMVPLQRLRQNNHLIGYYETKNVKFKLYIPRTEEMEDYLREHKQLIP